MFIQLCTGGFSRWPSMEMQTAAISAKSRNHVEVTVEHGLASRSSIGQVQADALALEAGRAQGLGEILGDCENLPGFRGRYRG